MQLTIHNFSEVSSFNVPAKFYQIQLFTTENATVRTDFKLIKGSRLSDKTFQIIYSKLPYTLIVKNDELTIDNTNNSYIIEVNVPNFDNKYTLYGFTNADSLSYITSKLFCYNQIKEAIKTKYLFIYNPIKTYTNNKSIQDSSDIEKIMYSIVNSNYASFKNKHYFKKINDVEADNVHLKNYFVIDDTLRIIHSISEDNLSEFNKTSSELNNHNILTNLVKQLINEYTTESTSPNQQKEQKEILFIVESLDIANKLKIELTNIITVCVADAAQNAPQNAAQNALQNALQNTDSTTPPMFTIDIYYLSEDTQNSNNISVETKIKNDYEFLKKSPMCSNYVYMHQNAAIDAGKTASHYMIYGAKNRANLVTEDTNTGDRLDRIDRIDRIDYKKNILRSITGIDKYDKNDKNDEATIYNEINDYMYNRPNKDNLLTRDRFFNIQYNSV